uniref:MFS transporter n=1 Tax=Fervidicoccus fontis TaxID=683846 RepID=A0A7J3ZJD5_9CREN
MDTRLPSFALVALSSAASFILALYASLKVVDITGSAYKLSLILLVYNSIYTLASLSWHYLAHYVKNVRVGIIVVLLVQLTGALLVYASSVEALLALGLVVFGVGSAILSPLLATILYGLLVSDTEVSLKFNKNVVLGSVLGYALAVVSSIHPQFSPGSVVIALLVLSLPLSLLAPPITVMEPSSVAIGHQAPPVWWPLKVAFAIRSVIIEELLWLARMVQHPVSRLRLLMQRRLPLTCIGVVVLFTGVGLFFTPFPALLRHLSMSDTQVYLAYAVLTIASFLTFEATEQAKLGSVERLYLVLMLAILARIPMFAFPVFLLLANERGDCVVLVIALMVGLGISWSFIVTAITSIMLHYSPHGLKSAGISRYNALSSAGVILGSLASTLVSREFGLVHVYALSSVLLILSLCLFYRAQRMLVT